MLYQTLFEHIAGSELQAWLDLMPAQIAAGLDEKRYGDLGKWQAALAQLPEVKPGKNDFNAPAICTGTDQSLSPDQRQQIVSALKRLMPWRKGPYRLHGVDIDTEWRSDWKWHRLADHIQPLEDRRVLDVGCGNGYHGWRMLGGGAELVIGIDPSPLFVMQYRAVRHFTGACPFYVLPIGIDAVPQNLHGFDSVFSMGVLYHRRSPIDHLMQLRSCLRPDGELVLETLVIEGDENQVLLPRNRYAKMRNVWFIPSYHAIVLWLKRCGFSNVQLVDVTRTSVEEQRRTEWMQFESLADYLDPHDPDKTVEGYPSPCRAIFTAIAP